ncbi:hypothetical protein M8J77_025961 [Diaphorina citri]|nr:hypothetical protein M8J77_025961 [Diaphorina citri]
MYQHNYDIKTKKNASALTNHVFENQHNFDFNNVKIIDNEKNPKKRKFLEAFHINKNSNTVNYRSDVNNTLRIYQNLIDTM